MADPIRKLNGTGLSAFEQYLRDFREGEKLAPPFHLLTDSRYSEPLEDFSYVERREFGTRYEMGVYLTEILEDTDMQSFLGDQGFWSWLALYWFDQLCPARADRSRKPSQIYNYILSSNYNHRPRHAVRTTWLLVSRYGETALFLLSKKPSERGELIEQLAARQHLISCRGVIEVANRLYYDANRRTFKRGATSTKRKGNIRRYIGYLQQLDLTYDLYSITEEALLNILPEEYEHFL
ncbi:hypothetical protein [Thiolapillus sp.]|uniref:hypothetical protein n=1 Tax=Thiolapillus sp. TaxID=2017437 RepID=UPI003AF41667